MKLRLTQAGFEKYTGQMGVVWFDDGLSTTDVLPIDAVRISAAIGATWENGVSPNKAQMYLDNLDAPAFVGTGSGSSAKRSSSGEQSSSVSHAPGNLSYTEDQLAKVADESGISGLRVIADTLGVKGTSIVGLINGIIKAQSNPRVEA